MATLNKDNRLWLLVNGKRKSIRLNKLVQGSDSRKRRRELANVVRLIGDLEAAHLAGSTPDLAVVSQVRETDWLERKCVELGLLEAREVRTVEELFDLFVETKKPSWKSNTLYKWDSVTRKHIVDGLGQEKRIKDLTRSDADMLHLKLKTSSSKRTGKTLSPAHISKLMANARSLFKFAVDSELIARNIFDHIKRGSEQKPEERCYEVSKELIETIIEAAPSAEWRLLIAIWRWMGARKTEPLELKVTDIHHDASYTTINISDAKRQDDYGKPVVRKVPVFPEMESYLLDVLETLNEGSVWLFPSLRKHGRSIDKPFKDIIKKAGHEPWPAICNNIRATRANEIERTYGGALESAWVGHDPKTYRKHYSQVQEADLVRACTTGANMVQHGGVHSGTVVLATKEHHEKSHLQEVARLFRSVQNTQVPPLGLEPRTL
jgi:site-specific recombinase XerD